MDNDQYIVIDSFDYNMKMAGSAEDALKNHKESSVVLDGDKVYLCKVVDAYKTNVEYKETSLDEALKDGTEESV